MSDADGLLDLSTQRPLAGSYDAVDAMGLFWSMTTNRGKGKQEPSFVKTRLTVPTTITFKAQIDQVLGYSACHRRIEIGLGRKKITSSDDHKHHALLYYMERGGYKVPVSATFL
jgi:Acyl-CoA thioester hydrolase/BAAT N-terminal region